MTNCRIRPLLTCDSWARQCFPFDVNSITNAVASDDIHNLRRWTIVLWTDRLMLLKWLRCIHQHRMLRELLFVYT